MRNYATGTGTEFIIRELHTLVDDPGLYNWEEIWDFLLDHGVILYDPASQTFRWNNNSYYRLTPGVLRNLIDSYALDCIVTHKRYVAGEIWTQRIRVNAANGLVRGINYTTDVHTMSAVYDLDGTRYATAACTHDGEALRSDASDAAWVKAERAWNLSILNTNTNNN